jgi:hypothetical protein
MKNEIKDLEKVLAGWSARQPEIEAVRRLEMHTEQTPVRERNKGYNGRDALRGFRLLVDAYTALNTSLTNSQTSSLRHFKEISSALEAEQSPRGRLYSTRKRSSDKMKELQQKGEVYIVSGHKNHFNIVRIARSRFGHTYTLYDAGHGARAVGRDRDFMVRRSSLTGVRLPDGRIVFG